MPIRQKRAGRRNHLESRSRCTVNVRRVRRLVLRRAFERKRVNRHIFGRQLTHLTDALTKAFRRFARQSGNQIGIDTAYADLSRVIHAFFIILKGMLATDGSQNIVVRSLGVYADTCDAAVLERL